MKSIQLALFAVLLSGLVSAYNRPEPAAPEAAVEPPAAEPAVAPTPDPPAAAMPAPETTTPADPATDDEDVDMPTSGDAPHSGGDKVGTKPSPASESGN